MTYTPPFLPEDRAADRTLPSRVARARKLREEAAAQVEQCYVDVKQREGERRSGDCHDSEMERLSVL